MADKKVEEKSTKESEKNTTKKVEKKKNVFSKIVKYFRECKGEIKKITWPTMNSVLKNVGIVVAVIIVMGLFIFGLDFGLSALLKQIMSV